MARLLSMTLRARLLMSAALLTAMSACGVKPHDCTLIGGLDQLTIRVDPQLMSTAASIDVTLCQDERCRSATARPVPAVDPDVIVDLDRQLGGGWSGDRPADAVVVARDKRGVELARTTDSFSWSRSYPNGRDCDHEPFLQHTIRVLGA